MRVWGGGWKPGKWKAQCDRCGWDFYNTQLRKEWTGLMTCSGAGTNQCWEPRHPQDFVRGVPDPQAVPWVRRPSEDGDTFTISITGLSTDSDGPYAEVGDEGSISYTISPDNGTETVEWSSLPLPSATETTPDDL